MVISLSNKASQPEALFIINRYWYQDCEFSIPSFVITSLLTPVEE
jgi:hypothetical protein